MKQARLEVRKINCTHCSAPLELYGGHKVETITCSYCGSVLDPHNEYAVLKAHREAEEKRRYLPLKIGHRGTLLGVEFTVIGLVTYRDDWDQWTDFCLFSPSHGYVWLSYERGHYVLSRRERDIPQPGGDWSNLNTKQTILLKQKRYRFYQAFQATIVDVAGELPWQAEVGEQNQFAEAIAPPFVLSQENNGQEIELYQGEYFSDEQIVAAFQLKREVIKPKSVHPAEPYRRSHFLQALNSVSKIWLIFAVLGLIYVLFIAGGETLLESRYAWQQISSADGVQTTPFVVTNPDELLKLEINSQVNNGWMWIEIDLTQHGDEVFSIGKEVSYYHGVEGGESWSEGSQSASTLFKVPEAGRYEFTLRASENGGYRSNSAIAIQVKSGVLLGRYFLILTLILLVATLYPLVHKASFEHQRWAGASEDDEDDA